MKRNIGTLDRLLRAGLGAIFLALAWWFQSLILAALALFSFYEAIVGLVSFLPVTRKKHLSA